MVCYYKTHLLSILCWNKFSGKIWFCLSYNENQSRRKQVKRYGNYKNKWWVFGYNDFFFKLDSMHTKIILWIYVVRSLNKELCTLSKSAGMLHEKCVSFVRKNLACTQPCSGRHLPLESVAKKWGMHWQNISMNGRELTICI